MAYCGDYGNGSYNLTLYGKTIADGGEFKYNETTVFSIPPSLSMSPSSSMTTVPPTVTYCGCHSCTQEVWDIIATDNGGSYSCGARISWLQSAQGHSEVGACEKVASEFPDLCLCGILPSS